jgi:hypothetical protein
MDDTLNHPYLREIIMTESNMLLTRKRRDIDPSIELFLEFEGPHGTTNFRDSSLYDKNIVVTGDVRMDEVLYKFGRSSCYSSGNGGYLTVANGVRGGLTDRDFCVEAWALWGAAGSLDSIFQIGGGLSNQYSGIILAQSGVYMANAAGNGWATPTNTFSETVGNHGAFEHFALVRRDGVQRLFYNGRKQGADVNVDFIPNAVNPERVMVLNQATAGAWGGYMDNFRITIDNYKYWDNFDPSTLTS